VRYRKQWCLQDSVIYNLWRSSVGLVFFVIYCRGISTSVVGFAWNSARDIGGPILYIAFFAYRGVRNQITPVYPLSEGMILLT